MSQSPTISAGNVSATPLVSQFVKDEKEERSRDRRRIRKTKKNEREKKKKKRERREDQTGRGICSLAFASLEFSGSRW